MKPGGQAWAEAERSSLPERTKNAPAAAISRTTTASERRKTCEDKTEYPLLERNPWWGGTPQMGQRCARPNLVTGALWPASRPSDAAYARGATSFSSAAYQESRAAWLTPVWTK